MRKVLEPSEAERLTHLATCDAVIGLGTPWTAPQWRRLFSGKL
jgi:hypothetical protein